MPHPIKRFFARYKNLSGNVLALSLVSLLNDTSSDIIYPLLPAFLALTLGASPFAIGLIEGFAESVAAFLKLFSGYLSDKFERRKLPVFLGYSLASITRPLLAFVTSWQQVLFVRVSDRVGKGIRGAPRDAIIAASVPEEKRGLAFGFNRAADHLGAVIGPIIAFVLLSYFAEIRSSRPRRNTNKFFFSLRFRLFWDCSLSSFSLGKLQRNFHRNRDAEN
jgi:MFS family permease